MDRRDFLKGAVAAAAGIAALAGIPGSPDAPEKGGFTRISSAERRRNRFVNVPLVTHEGRRVRFYDDLVRGKTVLLNMFYTVCTAEAICPLGTANLAALQELLSPRVGRDVFFCSITLDPENDTPEVLKRYARAFGAKPGWEFLTGEKEEIERLRRNLGYVNLDPVLDRDPSQHSGMLRYGIEPLERWAGCPILSRPEVIARSLARLEPPSKRNAPAAA